MGKAVWSSCEVFKREWMEVSAMIEENKSEKVMDQGEARGGSSCIAIASIRRISKSMFCSFSLRCLDKRGGGQVRRASPLVTILQGRSVRFVVLLRSRGEWHALPVG
jgi:hypothetical protein